MSPLLLLALGSTCAKFADAAWTTPLLPHHYRGAARFLSLEEQRHQLPEPIFFRSSNALNIRPDTKVPYLPTMSEALEAEPFLSHMSNLLRDSGLATLLDQSRGVTLFAPVNRNFEAWNFAGETWPIAKQRQALSNHVVPEVVHASELEEGQISFPTLRGVPLTLRVAARPVGLNSSNPLGFLPIPRITLHLNDSSPAYLLTAPEPLKTANGLIYAVESPLLAAEDELPIMETTVLTAQLKPVARGRQGKFPVPAASALASRSSNLLATLTQRSPTAVLQQQAATARLAASTPAAAVASAGTPP